MGDSSVQNKAITKSDSIMNLVAFRCGYYRHNIHRFAKDYLMLDLKIFQQILLWAMNEYDAFFFVAARSAGKTFLIAVYSVCRALLWPRTKIVVASYSYKQGREVVKKINDELLIRSPLLRTEITQIKDGQNDCCVYFKNGSFIRVVVAGESGRGREIDRVCLSIQ